MAPRFESVEQVRSGLRGVNYLADEGIAPIRGTASEVAAALAAFAEVGVHHLQVVLDPITEAAIEWLGGRPRELSGLAIDLDLESDLPLDAPEVQAAVAAERGFVDRVIAPHETRAEIIKALRLLRGKRGALPPKKHGNIPL